MMVLIPIPTKHIRNSTRIVTGMKTRFPQEQSCLNVFYSH